LITLARRGPSEDGAEPRGQRAEHLSPEYVEQGQYREEHQRQHREHQQRVEAATGEHAVGNLEQVDRQGQHQDVDENREHGNGDEMVTCLAPPFLQGILLHFRRGGWMGPGVKRRPHRAQRALRLQSSIGQVDSLQQTPARPGPCGARRPD
jgi:hypothetical protein